MHILSSVSIFIFFSVSQEFHLINELRQTITRKSPDQVIIHGQLMSVSRHVFPAEKIYHKYTRYLPNSVYFDQSVKSGPNMYERRQRNTWNNPKRDKSQKGWRNALLGSGNSDNGIPKRNGVAKSPLKKMDVSENDFQKLSTYSGRSEDRRKQPSENDKEFGMRGPQTKTQMNVVLPGRQTAPAAKTQIINSWTGVTPMPIPSLVLTKSVFIDGNLPTNVTLPASTKKSTLTEQTTPDDRNFENGTSNKNAFIPAKNIPAVNDTSMLKQIRENLYTVLAIKDENIQRDAMKKLVKDIVSESGILLGTQTPSESVDIETLGSILEIIKNISSKLRENQSDSGQNTSTISVIGGPLDQEGLDKARSASINSSSVNTNNAVVQSSGQNSGDFIIENKDANPSSSQSFQHLAGRSIYGAQGLQVKHTDDLAFQIPSTTGPVSSSPRPLVNKTDNIGQLDQPEALMATTAILDFSNDTADSLGYWGHLTAGLADILCSYCTQRGFQRCIERHCNRVN